MSEETFRLVQSILGALGVFGLLFYVRYTRGLLKSANQQAAKLQESLDLAREDFRVRSRPWLAITNIERSSSDEKDWRYEVKNVGQGPAIDAQMSIAFHAEAKDQSGGRFESPLRGWPHAMLLGPGEKAKCEIHLKDEEVENLDDDTKYITLILDSSYMWGMDSAKHRQVLRWVPKERDWVLVEETID